MTYIPITIRPDTGIVSLSASNTATNKLSNPTGSGGVINGAIPTNWFTQRGAGLTATLSAIGNTTNGLPFVDIKIAGTVTTTPFNIIINFDTSMTASAATAYTLGGYINLQSGSLTGITSAVSGIDSYASTTYLNTVTSAVTLSSSPSLWAVTSTTPATTTVLAPYLLINYTTGATINATFRFSGLKVLQASSLALINTDCSLSGVFSTTLAADAVLATPTNMSAGSTYMWMVTQDGTGGRVLSYGPAFKWVSAVSPALASGVNAMNVISAVSDGTSMFSILTTNFA